MTQEPYILITADTHGGGSHAQYREHLDPEWREPFDEWRGGYKNPSQEHYGSKKMRNWDLDIRTADPPKPEEYERCLAGIRAHNRWLKDFCAEDPARRAGIGVILPNDLDEAVKDIEFIANAGLRGGVLLPLI